MQLGVESNVISNMIFTYFLCLGFFCAGRVERKGHRRSFGSDLLPSIHLLNGTRRLIHLGHFGLNARQFRTGAQVYFAQYFVWGGSSEHVQVRK